MKYAVTVVPVTKGTIMAVLTSALGLSFVQSLIIAAVSAILSGIFLLISNWFTAKLTRENRELLHDIKRKVGASKRSRDEKEVT